MNTRPPFWSRLTWALTLSALLAGGAWLATGMIACGALSALLGLGACGAAWYGAGELVDDLGDADPQPADPYPGELQRQLALGQLANQRNTPRVEDDDERTEPGW